MRSCLVATLLIITGTIIGIAVLSRNAPPGQPQAQSVLAEREKAARPEPKGATSEPKPQEATAAQLIPAGKPAAWDDVIVLADNTGIKEVTLTDSAGLTYGFQDKKQTVQIGFLNRSGTRTVFYTPWHAAGFTAMRPELADDLGNKYGLVSLGFSKWVSGCPNGRIQLDKGKPLADVLLFERPVADARTLYLTLHGECIGSAGIVRFEMPARK